MLPKDAKRLQTDLRDGGFDPGPIDGIVGPRTLSATRNWAYSLPRELVDSVDAPLHYQIALKEIGVSEWSPGENPRIIEYHSATTLKATEDEVSWCSSFVCWCMEQSFVPSTRSAAARSWLGWGVETDDPRIGDVVVLWRESRDSWKGHVGFFAGFDGGYIRMLNGNVNDKVTFSNWGKSYLLGYRRLA